MGKFYHAVIIETLTAASRGLPKSSENLKPGGRFLLGHSLPMTARLHRALQLKTVKPRVRPCEGLCAPPPGQVASVHLQWVETRCWPLCERLWRGAVFTLEILGVGQKEAGGLGKSTAFP